jgi:hypothetical protein
MLRRFWKIGLLALRPIPDFYDRGQTVVTLILVILPSLAPAFYKLSSRLWNTHNGFTVSCAVLALLLIIALYRTQNRLDDVEDGTPKLVCRGTSAERDQPVQNLATGQVTGKPVFYHLKIENRPTGKADRQTARKVAGNVEIYDSTGKVVCGRKLHRWEQQPGPAEVGKMADLKQPLDIPPSGVVCRLDIAMKYTDEEVFYTPTNDSARYPGFRDPGFRFGPGEYAVDVQLCGENVDTSLKCRIKNEGAGKELDIRPI